MVRFPTILLLVILLTPTIVMSININVESINSPRENTYFEVCDVSSDFKIDISCVSQFTSAPKDDDCYIIGFNSTSLICDDIIANVTSNNHTKTKEIQFNDYETALLNSLESTYSLEPITIAMKIYGYSLLDMQEEVQQLLETLKLSRNNDLKCWPTNKCDIYETVEVLEYLSKAGIGMESRVYYDALLWVEFQQNKIQNEDWTITFKPYNSIGTDDEIICEAIADESTLDTFTLTKNKSIINYEFDYKAGSKLNLSCDKRFKIQIKNYFGDILLDAWDYGDDIVQFSMEGGCWSQNRPDWDVYDGALIKGKDVACAPGLTEKILLLNDLSEPAYDDGMIWLEKEIDRARIAGKQIKSNVEILNNINAFRAINDDDVKRWILFTQNNEGSFGIDDASIITTLNAIETFTAISDKEWRDDAINWVLSTRANTGWDSVLKNTLGYKVFMYGFNPITINPTILYFDDKLNFNVHFEEDIEYYIDENLENKINIDIDTTTGEGVATRIIEEDGLITGNLIIKKESGFKEFPVVSYKKPLIDFKFEKEYYFIEDTNTLLIPVEKSSSSFNCDMKFSSFFQNTHIEDVRENAFITYNFEEDFSGKINVTTICSSPDYNVTKNYSFYVRKYDYPPFKLKEKQINIPPEPGHILIENNLDENYTLNVNWGKQTNLYPIPTELSLNNKNLKIYIFQQKEHILQEQENNSLRLNALGYSINEPYTTNLNKNASSFDKSHEYVDDFSYKYIIILAIGIVVLALLITFTISHIKKKKLAKEKKQKTSKITDEKKKPTLLKKVKSKNPTKKPLLDVLVAMDKTLNEPEQDIVKELETDGFKENDIVSALREVEKYMNKKNTTKEATSKENTTKDATSKDKAKDDTTKKDPKTE